MGVTSTYIASSAMIKDGSVTEAKLAAEACSAAKMKKEGTSGYVLTSNGAGAVPSYKSVSSTGTTGATILLYPTYYDSVPAGTWVVNTDTNAFCSFNMTNSSNAQNDEVSWKVYLTAGTYEINMRFRYLTGAGIATFSVDGTDVGTIDTYGAGGTYNVAGSITGITIATSGVKDVNIKMATKNGSSSGYQIVICGGIAITRTA